MTAHIREGLKGYSYAEIAKAANVPVDQVANIMDGGEVTPEMAIKLGIAVGQLEAKRDAAKLMAGKAEAKSDGDGECNCPICTLRRTGELPKGIFSIAEIFISKDKPDTQAKPETKATKPASPAYRPDYTSLIIISLSLSSLGLSLVAMGASGFTAASIVAGAGSLVLLAIFQPWQRFSYYGKEERTNNGNCDSRM